MSICLALELPKRIRAGSVWVNTCRAISFVALFGGYKRSGLGRESDQQAIRD